MPQEDPIPLRVQAAHQAHTAADLQVPDQEAVFQALPHQVHLHPGPHQVHHQAEEDNSK